MKIITEVKTHSPFSWRSDRSWNELFKIANNVGDIISVHTDTRWHGSFDLVSKAKQLTDKPVLAKGIHATDEDIRRAVDAGADYVLIVGRLATVHADRCLVEPLSLTELSELPVDTMAVWNSRDLVTGGLKTETFQQAREVFGGWLCQASNVRTIKDVNPTADAVLVGTHLPEFAESLML